LPANAVNAVDVVVLACCLLAAIAGYWRGALLSVFSFAGFVGGALLGAQLVNPLAKHVASGAARVPIALFCVLTAAMLCQLVGAWIGGQLRSRVTWRPARLLDAAGGAVVSVLAALLVAWLLAVPLASSANTRIAAEVRSSKIVESVNSVLPSGAQQLYSSLRDFLDQSGFPQVFDALGRTDVSDVPPPDPALQNSPVVQHAQQSVLKVEAFAPSCSRQIEGSSFVYADEHVLTNAHVVAGTTSVNVQTGDGSLAATVVLYDPRRDIAVLDVPGLNAAPLPLAATPASTGADAIVLGYPQDGPYDARSARVRDHTTLSGRDIYDAGSVDRDVYAIRALVRSGNSGGPLITPNGQVLGIVFAAALDQPDTGFVLSDAELQAADVAGAATATRGVATGRCA
jgi:S1-C subfamily serine protease